VWESFDSIREVAGPVSMLFYGRLFELDPPLRRLFPGDMHRQGAKLMEMLSAVVGNIERFESLTSALARNDPPVLTKTDPPEAMTMDRHARCPEEAMPDLPPVVQAG
jgi:truncated hemoglobin YjbI